MHARPEGSMSLWMSARLVPVATFTARAPSSVLAYQCQCKDPGSDLGKFHVKDNNFEPVAPATRKIVA